MPDEAPDFVEEEIPEPTLAEGGEAALVELVEKAKVTRGDAKGARRPGEGQVSDSGSICAPSSN
jgi:hypothetical protein